MTNSSFWEQSTAATDGLHPAAMALTTGLQFNCSQVTPLHLVWFFSASGATHLPNWVTLYTTGQGNTTITPQWSGSPGSGWVYAEFPTTPNLSIGPNTLGLSSPQPASSWLSWSSSWWSTNTGPTAGGILTATGNTWVSGSAQQPNMAAADNYWIDLDLQPAVIVTEPDPPSNIQVVAGNRSVTISWGVPAHDGGSPIIGYRPSVFHNDTEVDAFTTNASTFSHTFHGLTNGVTYTGWVRSYNTPYFSQWGGGQVFSPKTDLKITTASLPPATVGHHYNQQLQAAGGTGPYHWSIERGQLPPGLSLHSATGVVSGTPL